jgi:hypothetical protein
MSTAEYTPSPDSTQPVAQVVSLSAQGRLNRDRNSKARAFIDVVLYFRPGGSLTIHGCTVVHEDGQEPAVLLPRRKGDDRYFPVVSNNGEIQRVIEQTALREYQRLRNAAE